MKSRSVKFGTIKKVKIINDSNMVTRLERMIGFPFYDFLVKARNPKTNEIKMVDWFQGKVTIEKGEKQESFENTDTFNEHINTTSESL